MTRMSSRSLQWWDRINERERLLRVVSVGPRELNGLRNSLSVAKSDAACCQAWLDRLGSVPSGDSEYNPAYLTWPLLPERSSGSTKFVYP